MLKKNDIIPLEITDITGQGSGIGRTDGMAIFVPLTAIGDVTETRIVKVKKSYAFGRIEKIVKPSALRCQPDCECFAKCGGCVFRHISYDEELKIKSRRVYDALTRIGGLSDFKLNDIVGCGSPDAYRNKSQMPIGRDKNGHIQMGFYGSHSHRIIDTDACHLQPDEFNDIAYTVKKWAEDNSISTYDEEKHTGLLRHLYMRKGFGSGEIMAALVINGETVPHLDELVSTLVKMNSNIKSIMLNINRNKTNVILGDRCVTVFGSDTITDELCGLRFDISLLSFYQVNHDQTEKLYAKAAELAQLTGSEYLIDLYCGAGTIGLSMADKVKKLTGIEIVPQAVENAKENARNNSVSNAELLCMDASQAAQMLAEKGDHPDVVVIDPPRKGCDVNVVRSICLMSPKRVVYVSCEPETLARDLKAFCENGYRVNEVTPVDMFPRTASVETVVLMSRS